MSSLEDKVAIIRADLYYHDRTCTADYWSFTLEHAHALTLILGALAALTDGPIVEIGTDSGMGTLALSHGGLLAGNRKIHTFDIDEKKLERAKKRLELFDITHVNWHRDTSDALASKVKEKVALAFIDGDHSYQGAYRDICNVTACLASSGVVLLHDVCQPGHPEFDKFPLSQTGVYHALVAFCGENPDWCWHPLWKSGYALLFRRKT